LPFALLFVAYALGIVIPFWLYVLMLLWCLLTPMWHRGHPTDDGGGGRSRGVRSPCWHSFSCRFSTRCRRVSVYIARTCRQPRKGWTAC
jgi:hypothetical protein